MARRWKPVMMPHQIEYRGPHYKPFSMAERDAETFRLKSYGWFTRRRASTKGGKG